MRISNLVFLLMLVIFPYNLTGFNFGNLVIIFISLLYLLLVKKIEVNKKILILAIIYFIIGFLSLLLSSKSINSISGLSTYLSPLVFYLIWKNTLNNELEERSKVIRQIGYIITISCSIYVLIQCGIKNLRVYGNISYANTYALILLIGIYINSINIYSKYRNLSEIILLIGIFSTGSRTTIVYLAAFIIFRSIINKEITVRETVLNLSFSIIAFILIDNYFAVALFILPIVFIIGRSLYNRKINKKLIIIPIIISGLFLFISQNYILDRLSNIGLKQGTLQERFIIYEDTAKLIIENPLGYGINTYENKILDNQSAYYGVKYPHNSLLQIGFEVGIIGIICFILLFSTCLLNMIKNNKFREGEFIFTIVFLHSLLDFDFSFVLIIALWMLIFVINEDKDRRNIHIEFNKVAKGGYAIFIVLISIILYQETVIWAGTIANKSGKFELAYNISKFSLLQEERVDNVIIDSKIGLYSLNNNSEELIKIVDILGDYKDNIRLKWKLAYVYSELRDKNKSIETFEEILNHQPYYFEVYKEYYNFLNKYFDETNDNLYSDKIEDIKNKFYQSLNTLNPRSKYIKNQLPNKFEEVLKMKLE